MDLDEYNEVKRTKMLLYGEPKSGKTAKVGQLAASGYKLWWFDLEGGIKTLRNVEILPAEFRKNISIFNIPDNKDLPIAIDVMRKLFKGGKHKFCYAHGASGCPVCSKTPGLKWSEEIDLNTFTDNDVLVLDSWSQLVDSAINKVTLVETRKNIDYKPTWDDWAVQGNLLREIGTKIQTANINIAVISHEVDIEKDEKKTKIVPIGGTRNFSATFGKYFDEVIYVARGNKKHSAYSSTLWNNTHLTGGRSGLKLEDAADTKLADIFRAGTATKG